MKKFGTDSQSVTKLATVRKWVADRLGTTRHERRVSAVAACLAKLTIPYHNLDRSDLRLLKMAAMVHDVGRSLSDKHHPAVGAKMILDSTSLPLARRHRRALAYLTLYHRGRVPEAGTEKVLRDGDDVDRMRLLLAFLRAADGLDCRSLRSPDLSVSRRGRCLRIVCRLENDSPKARRVFTRRKKFRMLEEMLDCKIEVAVESARRLRLVA